MQPENVQFKYSKRFWVMARESAMRVLSVMIMQSCHVLEKRSWFIQKKGFIEFLVKVANEKVTAEYPQNENPSTAAQCLACLSRIPLQHSVGVKEDDTLKMLVKSCDGKFVKMIVELIKKLRSEDFAKSIAENIANEYKYYPEIPGGEEEFATAVQIRLTFESYLMLLLANISELSSVENQIVTLLEQVLFDVLSNNPRDELLWKIEETDHVELIDHGYRISEKEFVTTFCGPTLLYSSGILLNKLYKHKNKEMPENEKKLFLKLAEKMKKKGNEFFEKKEYVRFFKCDSYCLDKCCMVLCTFCENLSTLIYGSTSYLSFESK